MGPKHAVLDLRGYTHFPFPMLILAEDINFNVEEKDIFPFQDRLSKTMTI